MDTAIDNATRPHPLVPTVPASDSAHDRILFAASELFCRCGISATGVDAIVEAAGTAKATLYKTFGSKEGLVEAVLNAEGLAWRTWFFDELDHLRGKPDDRLVAVFSILEKWFSQERFFGCPFINAVGEFDKQDDRYRSIALAHKSKVMERLTEMARQASLPKPSKVAHEIGLLMDGAIVAAMVTRDPKVARHAKSAARKVVDTAARQVD
ncbi:MAG: TetR family transcriptional regulator [Pseudomonadota bacterium]